MFRDNVSILITLPGHICSDESDVSPNTSQSHNYCRELNICVVFFSPKTSHWPRMEKLDTLNEPLYTTAAAYRLACNLIKLLMKISDVNLPLKLAQPLQTCFALFSFLSLLLCVHTICAWNQCCEGILLSILASQNSKDCNTCTCVCICV